MGFPRQEYWSELPFPSPGYLPNPGIEPKSPVSPTLTGGFFTTVPPGKPFKNYTLSLTKYFLYPRFTKERIYIQNKTELEQQNLIYKDRQVFRLKSMHFQK